MIIRGNCTKYIRQKPEKFNPLTAKEGDEFFVNGKPLEKYKFSCFDSDNDFWGYNTISKNTSKITWFNGKLIFVKPNPENLNFTTSLGIETAPDIPIISIPKCLQKYIPRGKRVIVRHSNNFYRNNQPQSLILISADTGPADRFVESVDVQGDIVTVKGRCADLPSEIFHWFEPDRNKGMIEIEMEWRE